MTPMVTVKTKVTTFVDGDTEVGHVRLVMLKSKAFFLQNQSAFPPQAA